MKQLRKIVNFRLSWPLGLYRVEGQSMSPALTPGQLLLGWRWGRPKAGQVVVARRGFPLVKRIAATSSEGVWLLGDNPGASTDSRTFGHFEAKSIEAVIIWPLCNYSQG
jgi:nickel-type superoxide dismutase maturation protease